MSDRVCYIRRTDRGARITHARLIAERSDESWTADIAVDAVSAEQAAVDAAEWVQARLSETRSAKRLDTVCLDVDGAVCSWVRGRDADAELIRAAVEGAGQGGAQTDEDGLDAGQAPGVADRLPRLPMEVSYGILGQTSPDQRAAVIAAPDAPARLFLDRLDAMGVRVGRVVTLWHALAEAWDPGAKSAATDAANIVATQHPPAAIVAIDHTEGRVVWAWAQRGSLIACGSIRVKKLRDASDERASFADVHDHDIARLAGDWLGWSAQIGVSPARVVIVGRPAPGGMSGAEMGRALTRAWPGALTDLVGTEDAVAETLRRTLDARPINAFAPLVERPTRQHRAAYRWSAAALLAASACVGVLAVALFGRASAARAQTTDLQRQRMELLAGVDPTLATDPFAVSALDDRIGAIERRTGALRYENPRPLLAELETISMVLAMPGVSVDEIDMTDPFVTVKTRVADVAAMEQLSQALRSIGGSQLIWRDPNYTSRGERLEVIYTATWPEQAGRSTP